MNKIIFLVLILTLIIYLSNLVIKRTQKSAYRKAGKKWDGIVQELRRRK